MGRTRLAYREHRLSADGLRVGVTVFHDVPPHPGLSVAPWLLTVTPNLDEAERLRRTLNAGLPMGHERLGDGVRGTEPLREALNAELPGLLAARAANGPGPTLRRGPSGPAPAGSHSPATAPDQASAFRCSESGSSSRGSNSQP